MAARQAINGVFLIQKACAFNEIPDLDSKPNFPDTCYKANTFRLLGCPSCGPALSPHTWGLVTAVLLTSLRVSTSLSPQTCAWTDGV